ncbi:hypothetical protein RRG08_035048 [Elysia crispata]|uniref:Uncharacterized protein n=1 Tax=Elysia crispata TaxID=231223 RepID=A0AAE0ZS75_9GAST|nr:hypothetical protein RRG08_035048 [Elysia crispata]
MALKQGTLVANTKGALCLKSIAPMLKMSSYIPFDVSSELPLKWAMKDDLPALGDLCLRVHLSISMEDKRGSWGHVQCRQEQLRQQS